MRPEAEPEPEHDQGDELARERAGLLGFGRPLHGLVLILAARGMGKTTMLKRLVARHAARGHPMVVWDYLGKYLASRNIEILRHVTPEGAAARAIAKAPCTLVMDEVDVGIPSTDGPLAEGSAVNEIILYGRQAKPDPPWRRKGPVALIGSARSPMDVHKRMRKLVDVIFVGRMQLEGSDVDWIAKKLGATSPREKRAVAFQVANLAPGRFLRADCS